MDKKKRSRSCNMSLSDKSLLADLVVKYKDVIENKKTDGVSALKKTHCWQELADEFNAISRSGINRDMMQLKHAYDNLKQKAKKTVSDHKVAVLKTGGGPCAPLPDDVTEKMLQVLGNRAKPLQNCYDSDAAYNSESVIYEDMEAIQVEVFETVSAEHASGATAVPSILIHDAVESTEFPFIVQSTPDNIMLTNEAVDTITSVATTSASSSVSVSNAAATMTTTTSRPYTATVKRRRPRRHFQSVSQDAAQQISSVAVVQADYYREKMAMDQEKLEMKRVQQQRLVEEHAKRMRVLDLQEQLALKKLEKLEE